MLIRTIPIVIAIAACAAPIDTTTADQQPITNTCNPVDFECSPASPISNLWCQAVCGRDGNAGGYCLEYSSVEIAYCERHPDKFFSYSPSRYCDIDGNPTWYTHCEPGWLP